MISLRNITVFLFFSQHCKIQYIERRLKNEFAQNPLNLIIPTASLQKSILSNTTSLVKCFSQYLLSNRSVHSSVHSFESNEHYSSFVRSVLVTTSRRGRGRRQRRGNLRTFGRSFPAAGVSKATCQNTARLPPVVVDPNLLLTVSKCIQIFKTFITIFQLISIFKYSLFF